MPQQIHFVTYGNEMYNNKEFSEGGYCGGIIKD